MDQRYGVTFDPATEVVSLIGSKEGIANMAVAFVDPGDVVLVPDPGYPVYHIGTSFNGGTTFRMPLRRENAFLPDLSAIPGPPVRRHAWRAQSGRDAEHRALSPRRGPTWGVYRRYF